MDIDVTIKGYRCFSPESPATIQLRGDVVALVGINNSGKSTLLRAFYELRPIFVALATRIDLRSAAIMIDMNLDLPFEAPDQNEIFWHFGTTDIEVEIVLPEQRDQRPAKSNWRLVIEIGREKKRVSVTLHDLAGNPVPKSGAWNIANHGPITKEGFALGTFQEMWAALDVLTRCFYCPAVRHVTAFVPQRQKGAKYYDIYTGKPFIDTWASRAAGSGKLATESIDAVVEDIRRVFRFGRLSIQSDEEHTDLLVTADGKRSRLSELGTGLAQFILLLGNLSFADPSYILIDEPESNLHPSLQLDFLNAVASRASDGVIFATHSLGLARQAADRIFAFNKTTDACAMIAFHQADNLAHVIGELSFGRSDFAPARKLLLVEGQTDVLTFQNFLAALGREHDFAIISLAGRDGIASRRKPELEHMLALGIDIAAVIDSERVSPSDPLSSDRQGFLKVCERLNIKCHVLERRATENYLTQKAIDKAWGTGRFSALKPHESLGAAQRNWNKKENKRIAREMSKSEIETTDLGKFLGSA
jgi:ABC-type cobalamin/Fe3+-siderophores transport system ATPase subunit